MAKYALLITLMMIAAQGFAQGADPDMVNKLDMLDQQKTLLQKQIDVVNLKNDLTTALGEGGSLSTVDTADLKPEYLKLVKITGLESAPQAVFLYNGYRLVADKGEMVLPTVQLRAVTASHVTVKDLKTGQESILWLTAETAAPAKTETPQ